MWLLCVGVASLLVALPPAAAMPTYFLLDAYGNCNGSEHAVAADQTVSVQLAPFPNLGGNHHISCQLKLELPAGTTATTTVVSHFFPWNVDTMYVSAWSGSQTCSYSSCSSASFTAGRNVPVAYDLRFTFSGYAQNETYDAVVSVYSGSGGGSGSGSGSGGTVNDDNSGGNRSGGSIDNGVVAAIVGGIGGVVFVSLTVALVFSTVKHVQFVRTTTATSAGGTVPSTAPPASGLAGRLASARAVKGAWTARVDLLLTSC